LYVIDSTLFADQLNITQEDIPLGSFFLCFDIIVRYAYRLWKSLLALSSMFRTLIFESAAPHGAMFGF